MDRTIQFEGRSIVVPNDATDAEITSILSSYDSPNFDTTPGGAAISAPRNQPRPLIKTTGGELMADLGGATAAGGVLGLIAPEPMQALGATLKAIPTPMTQAIGGGLEFAGRAARAAGPTARVISGALSGLGSETSGKIAEGLGAGPVMAEAARFVGGGLSPEIVRQVGTLAANVTSHYLTGGMTGSAMRTLAGQLQRKITDVTGQPLTDAERAYVDKLISDIHTSQNPNEALGRVGETMRVAAADVAQTGERRAAGVVGDAETQTAKDVAAATQTADQRLAESRLNSGKLHTASTTVLNDAETAARAELDAVKSGATPYDKAAAYLKNLKNQTLNAAKSTLGVGRDSTAIGTELRDAATKRERDFRTAASSRFETTKNDVNAIIAKLENAGITIDQNPAFKKIIIDLNAQLAPGKNNKSVAAGYQKLLDELTTAEGVPITYNSVDQTRRLLGESFGGLPVEGYSNIDLKARQDLYKKIRDLQVRFGGEKVDTLLTNYADSRPELAVFGSKAGQQLTGLDRSALTQFATDPAKMPAYFFKTQTSFQHLVELVGDKALATQAGLDHITAELASKDTAAKVRTWMTTNRNMLDAVPGAKAAVDKYATALASAEKSNASIDAGLQQLSARRTAVGATAAGKAAEIRQGGATQSNQLAAQAKGVETEAEATRNALVKTATDEAAATMKAATGEAKRITAESSAAADKIWNRTSASPQFNARKLIEGGDATQWELVAPIIQRSPKGTQDMLDALRQVLADRLSNPKGSTQFFNETISPAMVQFGMLAPAEAQKLSKQLAVIEAQRVPPVEELGKWNRMLLQAIGGHVSSLAARGARAGFAYASDIPAPSKQNALAPK